MATRRLTPEEKAQRVRRPRRAALDFHSHIRDQQQENLDWLMSERGGGLTLPSAAIRIGINLDAAEQLLYRREKRAQQDSDQIEGTGQAKAAG